MEMENENGSVRILLVVKHALIREALATALAREAGFEVVGSVGSGRAAVDAYASVKPDVTLIDMRIPLDEVTETLGALRSRFCKPVVVLLASTDMPHEASRAKELGANGYVSRQRGMGAFCSFITQVVQGHLDWNTSPFAATAANGDESLSSREFQVLECARRGLSNSDIGRALHISENTVKSHIRSILQKFHAADRAEAVARGFELGLLH